MPPHPLSAHAHAAAAGGCAYVPIDVDTYGKKPFQNPPEIRSAAGRLETDLVVRDTDPRTTSMGGCPLTSRGYDGALGGPTLRVRPGDVLSPTRSRSTPGIRTLRASS